jgi:hypothetical protein
MTAGSVATGNSYALYNSSSPLGTNTNEVLEYDSSVPFLDLFKASLPFREGAPYLTKGQVTYDRNGWPTSIAPGGMVGTRVISKLHKDAIPRGNYTVLYDGQGKLEYGLDAKLVQQQPGRDIIYIDPGKDNEYNVKLTIKSTQQGNHLRNIRILPEGGICGSNPFQRVNSASQCRRNDYLDFARNHEKIIFNPDYLKFMRDYKVIRFMNMSGVTRNPIQNWADRPHVDNATWGGAEGVRGAPIEIMVELANRLHADAWFNIPHAANNDYVRRFAQYVRQNLNPELKVYLEYSNETWNGIFSQHAYMKQGSRQLGLTDEAVAGSKFYSKRSVEIFRIWEQVFGGNQRLIRTMAGLTGNTKLTETVLQFEEAYKHVDAFAVAPYVFGDTDALRRARSVQQVFQIMQDKRYGHSLPRVLEAVRKQSAIASKYGVDLIAYEGGQHLIDMKTKQEMQHPNPLFYKANRHPQMGTIYKKLLLGWKQAGGKMFAHFSSPRTYNRFGSKGVKEYITQPDHKAPKQLAIQSFIKSNPCWWQGCRSGNVYRVQKPQVQTTRDLAIRSGDKAPPLPNTREEMMARNNPPPQQRQPARPRVQQPEIPQLSGMYDIPQIDSIPAPRSQSYNPPPQVYQDIPHLEPVMAQPRQQYQPILIALKQPPRENYVFGDRAVSDYTANSRDPLSRASTYQLRRVISGEITDSRDLAAIWQSSWDQTNLYLRIAVRDDVLKRDSVYNWEDDSIEIFLDADASKHHTYDRRNDFHMLYRWRDKRLQLGKNSMPIGVAHTSEHIQGRYVLDLSIPWSVMNVRPRPGHRIGLDIHVNDDDNGGGREGKLAWRGTDEAYRDPSVLGEVVLR